MWLGWLHTIKLRQSDGITAYQRLSGMSFGPKLLPFGECCVYKLPKKTQETSLEGKLGTKWHDGIFLEFSRDSNEYIRWATKEKTVVRARSLQRKPELARWSADGLAAVNQRPQDMLYRASAAPTGRREPQQELGDRIATGDAPPKTRTTSLPDLTSPLRI